MSSPASILRRTSSSATREKARTRRYLSLSLLALQNAILALVLHASRHPLRSGGAASDDYEEQDTYFAPSVVLFTEVLKSFISAGLLGMALRRQQRQQQRTLSSSSRCAAMTSSTSIPTLLFKTIPHQIFASSALTMSLPATLYVLQNNLQYIAAENLEPIVFQALYQFKILTTALCSWILLGKRIERRQWIGLGVLVGGTICVQIGSGRSAVEEKSKVGEGVQAADPLLPKIARPGKAAQDELIGILAVSIACWTSALAGVWFERALKQPRRPSSKPTEEDAGLRSSARRGGSTDIESPSPSSMNVDLWTRNLQLSSFSLLPALLPVLFKIHTLRSSSSSVSWTTTLEPLTINAWGWVVVILQVTGGLLTALVMRYADNVLKGFAVALSLLLTGLLSGPTLGYPMTQGIWLGGGLIMIAVWMYHSAEGQGRGRQDGGSRENGRQEEDLALEEMLFPIRKKSRQRSSGQ